MALQIEQHLFTLDEYERLVEAGVLAEDAHVELIRGAINEMAPVNYPHEACVIRITNLLYMRTSGQAVVSPQGNSLRLPGHSRPQPDLALLRWRDPASAGKPPTVEELLLVVEVSDSSLKYDRDVKGPLYAEAGIPIYWIVNLRDQQIEVYTQPGAGAYRHSATFQRDDTLALPAPLPGTVAATDILGPPGAPAN